MAWYTIPVFQKRLLPLLDWQHEVSTKARLIVWDITWKLFLRNPIFGVGPRHFPRIVIKDALVPGQAPYLSHAHSNYLHALATTGVIGFSAYVWVLLASFGLAWQQFRSEVDLGVKVSGNSAFRSQLVWDCLPHWYRWQSLVFLNTTSAQARYEWPSGFC